MKKNYSCPACGNTVLTSLFITTPKGRQVSLHLSSQAEIRRSNGEVCCIECKQTRSIQEFQHPIRRPRRVVKRKV